MSSLALLSILGVVRIRVPELLETRQITPYRLHKLSGGRISLSTAYRLNRLKGRLKMFDRDLLDALCDVLGVGPSDLFEREKRSKAKGA